MGCNILTEFPPLKGEEAVILGAFEFSAIGQREFQELFLALQIWDISQHRAIQRLDPRADASLAQALNGGMLTIDRIEQNRIPSNA